MAFFTATLYSITDSIVDYHACAKMARVPPPPTHAINRGIMVEFLSPICYSAHPRRFVMKCLYQARKVNVQVYVC
jgi:hypothetical protein